MTRTRFLDQISEAVLTGDGRAPVEAQPSALHLAGRPDGSLDLDRAAQERAPARVELESAS